MTSTKWNIPGSNPLPIFGNRASVVKLVKDSIGYTDQLFKTYGNVVSLSAGGGTNIYSPLLNCPGTVFTYGPESMRQAISQLDVYSKYPLSGTLYRKRNDSPRTEPLKHFLVGLFGVNGQTHRQHRKLLMPAFHKQRIDTYRDDMVAISQLLLEKLPVDQPTDIAQVMRMLTLRITAKTLLGSDLGEGDGKKDDVLQVTDTLQKALALQNNPLLRLFPVDLPGLPFQRYLNLIAKLDEKIRTIIRTKQASGVNDSDVLSMLIESQDADSGLTLTEDELLGHTSAIFSAAHGTSANALTWTLFLLSQHPNINADLVDELQSVLQGEAPTIEQLHQLPLLERVIKESMRILPSVPWNLRVTSQLTQLENYELPIGTEVFVSIYKTHRMPEIYLQPEKFNPQRWENFEPTIFEYNPFSAGTRLCIGAGFAMMEIKIILAMLLQEYRLEFSSRYPIARSSGIPVLYPKYGMQMLVRQQDRQFTQGVGGVQGNVRQMVDLPT
ncbi:cytochrome P450 [Nostoc sp.]|uniref:cytochrome P450 n=1 Tax=Nostoc sp. TaxID=1180 RepID=UPI002FFB9C9B